MGRMKSFLLWPILKYYHSLENDVALSPFEASLVLNIFQRKLFFQKIILLFFRHDVALFGIWAEVSLLICSKQNDLYSFVSETSYFKIETIACREEYI